MGGSMTWISEYHDWLNLAWKRLGAVDPKRILQVVSIFCLCLIFSMIIHKGFTDISALVREHPDDFWRALGQYLFDNLAGQGQGRGL